MELPVYADANENYVLLETLFVLTHLTSWHRYNVLCCRHLQQYHKCVSCIHRKKFWILDRWIVVHLQCIAECSRIFGKIPFPRYLILRRIYSHQIAFTLYLHYYLFPTDASPVPLFPPFAGTIDLKSPSTYNVQTLPRCITPTKGAKYDSVDCRVLRWSIESFP